jgi:hypothetical protein
MTMAMDEVLTAGEVSRIAGIPVSTPHDWATKRERGIESPGCSLSGPGPDSTARRAPGATDTKSPGMCRGAVTARIRNRAPSRSPGRMELKRLLSARDAVPKKR